MAWRRWNEKAARPDAPAQAALLDALFGNSPYLTETAIQNPTFMTDIGAFIPALAEKVHWLWMKLGEGMGFVTSKIILTIIFFVVLVPVSWLAAIFRKPVMKMKREGDTFYKSRNFTYTQKSMQDVW